MPDDFEEHPAARSAHDSHRAHNVERVLEPGLFVAIDELANRFRGHPDSEPDGEHRGDPRQPDRALEDPWCKRPAAVGAFSEHGR